MSFEDDLRSLLSERGDEWDAPGDEWLFRPNPDEASLSVDYLAHAILDLVRRHGGVAAPEGSPQP